MMAHTPQNKHLNNISSRSRMRAMSVGCWLVILGTGVWIGRDRLSQVIAMELDSIINPIKDVTMITDDQGFGQIRLTTNEGPRVLTDSRHPKIAPLSWRDQIFWLGQPGSTWQVYTYSTTTNQTTQLTNQGNQANLVVATDFVAWEGQVNGVWQIFVFDGWRVNQITTRQSPSSDLVASGNQLAFVQRDLELGAMVMLYDHNQQSLTQITPDFVGLHPEFVGGKIRWATPTEFGSTFFDRDLATGEIVASESVAELNLLIEMTREASAAAALLQHGNLEDQELLQTLIDLGIADVTGKVAKD